jgi:putative phosphoesterase
MKLAILSNIHGNLVALEAVLADLDREGVDKLVCLGDVAALGPQPCGVLKRLRELNCPTVIGNTDAWLLNPQSREPVDEDSHWIFDIEDWCVRQLSPSDSEYLRTFRPTIQIPLGDGATLLCVHGSPRSNEDVILATTPDEELDRLLEGFHVTVMTGGHTHTQMFRCHRDMVLMNPGSVGLPFERDPQRGRVRNPARAEYALLRWEHGRLGLDLCRIPLDAGAVVQAALDSDMPHREWWAKDWAL